MNISVLLLIHFQFQIKNELLNVKGGKVNEHSLQNNENKEGSFKLPSLF